MTSPCLVWFRHDLRIADNPALHAAVESGAPVLCFYILDEESPGLRPLGGAARWWLHGSLQALEQSLRRLGAPLQLFRGPAGDLLERIGAATGAGAVFWNRRYAAAEVALDRAVEHRLTTNGIAVHSFNGLLLNEPWQVRNRAGRPYQVFTPYLRAVMASRGPETPLPRPQAVRSGQWPAALASASLEREALELEPHEPDWAAGLRETWRRGEAAAQERLGIFVSHALRGYAETRNYPSRVSAASRLSPHLRFGEISPRQVLSAVGMHGQAACAHDVEKFSSEVIWRDFCYQILHDNPTLSDTSLSPRLARLPWRDDRTGLTAWQRGKTGYPIVDAGMRQLWRTGWMHNRVRMIAASFLVKHLMTDWRHGEAWFWDTLVDADPANNAFNWQWIAGTGPDAAPFHRIFNPVVQGERFDPDGAYVRAHVPELAGLPGRFIHRPWEASAETLRLAGIVLGESYPRPIVEHEFARNRALEVYRGTGSASSSAR